MYRQPSVLSCALAATSAFALIALSSTAIGDPPDDNFGVEGKGRMHTNVDGTRTNERVEGGYSLSGASSVSGEFEGDTQSVSFSADADPKRRGFVFKLSGGDATADTPSGTVNYDNARGWLKAKETRRGTTVSKIKIKARTADGDRLHLRARGKD
ncbi:MAG: hypothetical protein AAGB29_04010 [Planctomycetota bacterium]